MNNIRIFKSKITIYILLFILAFIVNFASPFNPLNFREMYIDSSVYITVTHYITKGLLLYKDIADNKGPLLYFINVPGYFLGGFTGVWITQLIMLFISIFFAYKTALLFGNKINSILCTFFSFFIFLRYSYIQIGAEEYSLPFMMISIYIFCKHYFSSKRETNFFDLMTLGICFTFSIIMRLNMFSLWAGFCFVIFIESIIRCHFLLLLKYILG